MNSDGLSNLVSQEDMFREAKKDIEQSNCIEKQGNIIEEKGGMRKKWLRFALSSIG